MKWPAIFVLGLAAAAATASAAPPPSTAPVSPKAQEDASPAAEDDPVAKGSELLRAGELEAALAEFERAVALEPQSVRAHAQRALALYDLARLAEAEAAVKRAAELHPEDPDVEIATGLIAIDRGEYEKAAAAFSRLIEMDPGSSWVVSMRAKIYELMGKGREAAAEMERAAALDPDDAALRREQARILADIGATQPAIDAAVAAAAVDRTPQSLVLKADILLRAGRMAEAAVARAAAVAMAEAAARDAPKPHPPQLVDNIVSVLSGTGDHAGAIAAATAALRTDPGNPSLLSTRCLARAAAGIELVEAKRDCDESVAADPADIYARITRALLAVRLREWDLVISDCALFLARKPRSASCTFARGLARLGKGETEAGKRDLVQARRYEADIEWDFRRLGLSVSAQAEAGTAQ